MTRGQQDRHPREPEGVGAGQFERRERIAPIRRPSAQLTRDDIVDGVRALATELRRSGHAARLQIVGGAAIALTVNSLRHTTRDVDAVLTPVAAVDAAAATVADRFGWPHDWVNDDAAQFVPSGFGRRAEWSTLHKDDTVTIEVASIETLLAMKLHAAQRRGARESADLMDLLPLAGLATVDDAEALYGEFYPGDEFTERTARLVRGILDAGAPAPEAPPAPDFS
ncbi:MAG: hypothetical protein LBE60_10000 [Microbacterium sp.]|jgi:hypothetical protein|uniref:hypothetical protein n=1 Tax=Microbacterium sp. TaxID=51671 RepID=UPI0028173D1E|nr:hypothetical protein [Microbacterium sp.]MDR2321966.1 hypothetical protein [Microbacterium sp.]